MQFAVDPSLPSSPASSLQIVNKGDRCQMKLDRLTLVKKLIIYLKYNGKYLKGFELQA